MSRKSKLCLVGIFPPPLCGMSLINEYVRARLAKDGVYYTLVNTAPDSLNRNMFERAKRFTKVCVALSRVLVVGLSTRVARIYIGISGGWGQVYDLVFLMMAKLAGCQIYIHHHNYTYLDNPWFLARWLMLVAGRDAVHIVACEKMECDLKFYYQQAVKTMVVSGVATLDSPTCEYRQRLAPNTLGFLSNITREKGIFEFIQVAIHLHDSGINIRADIAGPFENEEIRDAVMGEISPYSFIQYVGSKYGSEKSVFFDQIDVLLFPTKSESEGLVIHEAMGRGIPVVASARGCIEQVITEDSGRFIMPSCDFVDNAVKVIQGWSDSPEHFCLVSKRARQRFEWLKEKADQSIAALISKLAV